MFQTTGVEPVVKNWCRIDDGPASALARQIVKTWQSLNSSSRNRQGANSSTTTSSISSRSTGTSNISSHKNGRSFNRHLLKSPSLSPSSDSESETTAKKACKTKPALTKQNDNDTTKSDRFSPKKETTRSNNGEQGNTNGDADNSPSISISSSSDDEKSSVAETKTNINETNSIDKPPELTPAVANDVSLSPTVIGQSTSQSHSSTNKITHENDEKHSLDTPEAEKVEAFDKCAEDAKLESAPSQELYSPGNPTGGGRGEFELSNSDSSGSPKASPTEKPEEKEENSDATKEFAPTPKSVVSSVTSVLSSVVASTDDWRGSSHQSEKLRNLKRRAALICNLPELASSAASDKETSKDRRSPSGSPRKRKKYKKEKKSKERRSKKKSSRRKDHRRDYSESSRSRRRGSKSKSRSKTKENNLQYDSLSGAESRSD